MVEVEELVERRVIGLDLGLRSPAEEAKALGEVDGMEEHVQLGKSIAVRLRLPVLMDIRHHAAPDIDLLRCPVFGMKQRNSMVQLLEPASEDGVRRLGRVGHGGFCSCSRSRRQYTRAALLLDPLGDLLPIQLI